MHGRRAWPLKMRLNRGWQIAVVIMLTVMVSLNLKLLVTTSNYSGDVEVVDGCPRHQIVHVQGSLQLNNVNMTNMLNKWHNLQPGQARVFGNQRPSRGFLTIGIPSIKRLNGLEYLEQTISSVIDRTSTQEKLEVVTVVFLADFDNEYNEKALKQLSDRFPEYIKMGFLQILQASKEFYPQLVNLKRNFKDKADRVTWRSKQVSDFAFMFLYGKNLSDYYIQLEDDVICAPEFLLSIRQFINRQKRQWAMLEFSELGFIGKLFKSKDLQKLATFMMTFYDEQPIDWLIRYFRMAMAQERIIMRKPTLFQHMGLTSSFDTSKKNKLKDRFFDSGEKKWKADDPPATVITNMTPYMSHAPDLAYGSGSGYFWAKEPKEGSFLYIIFEVEEQLRRIVVETGHHTHPKDVLESGTLDVSPKLLRQEGNEVRCANLYTIATFQDGRVDIKNLPYVLGGRKTKCLKITVTRSQQTWLVVHQVAVYVVGGRADTYNPNPTVPVPETDPPPPATRNDTHL